MKILNHVSAKRAFSVAAIASLVGACAADNRPPAAPESLRTSPRTETSVAVADRLAEVRSEGVAMECGTVKENHEVLMTASNSDSVDRLCEATCYYKDKGTGALGSLHNKKTVPANAKGMIFARHHDPDRTFEVVNPGTAACN